MGNPFSIDGFLRRGECGDWSSALLWTMNCSDLVVAFCFIGISTIMFYVLRMRRDLPIPRLWSVLAVTTGACGGTHCSAFLMTWWPAWWIDALIRAGTAVLCLSTLVAFLVCIGRLRRLVSPAQVVREQRGLTEDAEALVAQMEKQGKHDDETTRRCVDQVRKRLDSIGEIRTELRIVERGNGLATGGG